MMPFQTRGKTLSSVDARTLSRRAKRGGMEATRSMLDAEADMQAIERENQRAERKRLVRAGVITGCVRADERERSAYLDSVLLARTLEKLNLIKAESPPSNDPQE
jgi:hypothetical protein